MIAKAEPERPLGLSRDEAHNYYYRDTWGTTRRIPSVTKVVGILEKPALVPAASRIVAQYATAQLEDVGRLVLAVGQPEAVKKLAGLPRAEWDLKADLGSRVHTLAEFVLRGVPVGPRPDEAPYVEGLQHFIEDAHPIPLALEEMIAYEDEVGIAYAGTFDAVLELASGRWLIDFKTGKDIWDETALQLAAYGHASFVGRSGDTCQYAMPQVDAYAVLHLHPAHPRGYAFVPYEVGRREWLTFMALLDAYEWARTPKTRKALAL